MSLQLIDDGYTLESTVKARGYEAVLVKYRQALPERVKDFVITRARAETGKAEMKAISHLLAKHVQGWDIVDGKGNSVPVNEAIINRIPEPVLNKIIDLVTGYRTEDAEADEKNSD